MTITSEALLVPVPHACLMLGCGRTKFYELVAADEIRVVRLGRRTLVARQDLDDFVDRLRGTTPQHREAADV